jgi:hypothetical protein
VNTTTEPSVLDQAEELVARLPANLGDVTGDQCYEIADMHGAIGDGFIALGDLWGANPKGEARTNLVRLEADLYAARSVLQAWKQTAVEAYVAAMAPEVPEGSG